MGNKAGADKPNRLYIDLEPYCSWHRKEDTDILDIHLNGFEGEQLKLRIDNARILTISGERPWDDDNNKWSSFCKQTKLGKRPLDDNNKWGRFCKKIKMAENIKVDDISFRLTGGILSVVMPKKPEITCMSISQESEVLQMGQNEKIMAMKDAGVWWSEIDKNMVVEVGVVLVILLLGFGVFIECLCGK